MNVKTRIKSTYLTHIVTAAAVAAFTLCEPSIAQIWDIVPDVTMAIETIDNPRLQTGSTVQESDRAVVDARLRLTMIGQRGQTYVEPRVRSDQYAEAIDKELESNDLFLRANGQYRWQTVSAGFLASFSQQSIRNSEFLPASPDDPDIEDPDEGESGFIDSFETDRGRSLIRPSLEFHLSERTSIAIDAEFDDVSYSGPDSATRTDYTAIELSAGVVKRVRERNQVSARFIGSTYEAEQNGNVTDSIGVEGAFTRPLSETWTLNVSFGAIRSDFSFIKEEVIVDPNGFTTINQVVVDNAETTPTYSIGFRRRSERHTLNLNFGRRVSSNSSGFVSQRDELRFFGERQLTARLSGRAGIRFWKTVTIANVRPQRDREDTRVDFTLIWAITERLSLNAGYETTARDYVNRTENADSEGIYIGLNYTGLSRIR